jgi:glycosyltransferase involved in cell wall biosynthesis
MVVAVNTRLLLSGKMEGIGWFTFEILKRMVQNNPRVEFHFFFDRPFDASFIFGENVTGHLIRPPVRHPFLFDWWFNWSVPRRLKNIKADVFVSMDGFCSLRTKVPQVLTIHDLNFMHHPEHMATRFRTYLPKRTKQFVQRARTLTTVSHYSAKDIQQTFQIHKHIEVIYNAAADVFVPLADEQINAIRARLTNGKPYFLFVSSIHPRKNLERILQAYEIARNEGYHNMPLVVVGRRFWMSESIDKLLLNMTFQKDVLFVGSLAQTELAQVTGAAHALIYASLYEGFGIPIIEAMQCGVPVITSNCTAMPEVAGNAALLIDPYQTEEIAEAMCRIASDPQYHKQLAMAGKIQATKFNWQSSADLFWRVIEKTVKDSMHTSS